MELDGGARAIPVEKVVDAAFDVYDEGDGDANEIELLAKIFLDVVFDGVGGNLSFLRGKERGVVLREDFSSSL